MYSLEKIPWKWIAIYLVIGLVAYGAIYYFFFYQKGGYSYAPQNDQTEIQNNTYQTQNPTETNIVADWKAYRNDEYGFEIKYPENATLDQTDYDTLENKDVFNKCVLVHDQNTDIYISFLPNNVICGGTTGLGIGDVKTKEVVTINGKNYETSGWKMKDFKEFLSFSLNTNINITYEISDWGKLNNQQYTEAKNLIYSILSTIRFTK